MKRWKHMDKLMTALSHYVGTLPGDQPNTRVLGPLSGFMRLYGRTIDAYMVICPKGQDSWMTSFGNSQMYSAHTRVRMPRSFREWTVARNNGPMKPFNYMLTEGDKCGLEQAGFIDLPE